jgi:SNF family Na+-dependent transporter
VDRRQKSLSEVNTSNEGLPDNKPHQVQDLKHCRLSYEQMDNRLKRIISYGVLAVVVALAMVPPKCLVNIYAIAVTVCCPLIATVLPGFFFYINSKINNDAEQNSKFSQAVGLVYACCGLFVMPLFLMLTMYTIQN